VVASLIWWWWPSRGGDRRALPFVAALPLPTTPLTVGPMPGLLGMLRLHDEPKNVGLVVLRGRY
jgi:hypothetical protein